MNIHPLTLAGETLHALPEGALWWPDQSLLAVSDLHLGKAERFARMGRGLLPPYETEDTLNRLDKIIDQTRPERIVFLGDSFDDNAAARAIVTSLVERFNRIAAGRILIWVAGNHDPGPVNLPGAHLADVTIGPLTFRHIARTGATGEVSGHFHPKAKLVLRGQTIRRPCFLSDASRLILPAFGTYTGGLKIDDPVFDRLMAPNTQALLTGRRITAIPRAAVLA